MIKPRGSSASSSNFSVLDLLVAGSTGISPTIVKTGLDTAKTAITDELSKSNNSVLDYAVSAKTGLSPNEVKTGLETAKTEIYKDNGVIEKVGDIVLKGSLGSTASVDQITTGATVLTDTAKTVTDTLSNININLPDLSDLGDKLKKYGLIGAGLAGLILLTKKN